MHINNNLVGNGEVMTGNITANSQSANTTFDVGSFGNITFYCTGTFSTVNVTFEGSVDRINWFTVTAKRSNDAAIESATGNLSAAPAYAWECSTNSYSYFRIRSTAWTSGTQVWTLVGAYTASEPNPAMTVIGTVATSGSATTTPLTPTAHALSSAGNTNPTSVKSTAGTVYAICASNTNAAVRYLKVYNKASAPTVGTDVPILTLGIQPSVPLEFDFGPLGYRFSAGIAYALTTGATDADTAAVAAAEIKVTISYV